MNHHLCVEFCLVFSYIKTIFKENDFKKTRDALKAKPKQLKRPGLGNRLKATMALVDNEIVTLFDKVFLGLSLLQALYCVVK